MPDASTPLDATSRKTNRLRKAQVLGTFGVLLLLAATVPPFVNIKRFRHGILQAISEGLGRPVRAGSVELILLPRPAFVLHRFTVAEDPAYGAEPVLMAGTVTASLRASTLWHRRVEIATLSFDAPSLNLTRNAAGSWNFETLLHSSSTPAGPATGAKSASAGMPFPYVEASEARINFKSGVEKLPFSLEGTDLALWKESGGEWHLRIKARPVRTDLTVADAGQIRGEAVLHASGPLEDAPVRASLEWRRVQLGDVDRMLQGKDDNWRGVVDWTAHAQGTLASVLISTDVQVSEFRRAEFVPAAQMGLHLQCHGAYVRRRDALDGLQCSAPAGDGMLRVVAAGMLPLSSNGANGAPDAGASSAGGPPAITLLVQHVPAQSVLEMLRHVHPGVPSAAVVSGELNGTVACQWAGIRLPNGCSGQLQSTSLALRLPQFARPLQLSRLTLAAAEGSPGIWQLQPSPVSLGAGTAATWSGTFSASSLALRITGPAKLRNVFRLAQAFRIPALSGDVRVSHGSAQLALAVQAAWLPQPLFSTTPGPQSIGFAPSLWTGNVQIRNAVITLPVLRRPLQLASAEIELAPGTAGWNHLSGTYGHVPFDGSLRWQFPCASTAPGCARTLLLHARSLNAADFLASLQIKSGPSHLLELVNPWAASVPKLPQLDAIVSVDLLTFGRLPIEHAALDLGMGGQTAELKSISGNVLGGTISAGDLTESEQFAEAGSPDKPLPGAASQPVPDASRTAGWVRWGDGPPAYSFRATLTRIQPDRVAALWRERWGGGVADAVFSLTTKGWSASDLAQYAEGKFSLHWADGSLGPPESESSIKFQSWRATGLIAGQRLVLRSSQMNGWTAKTRDGISGPLLAGSAAPGRGKHRAADLQTVTGSISFRRALHLELQPSGASVSGTLASPVVESHAASGSAGAQP